MSPRRQLVITALLNCTTARKRKLRRCCCTRATGHPPPPPPTPTHPHTSGAGQVQECCCFLLGCFFCFGFVFLSKSSAFGSDLEPGTRFPYFCPYPRHTHTEREIRRMHKHTPVVARYAQAIGYSERSPRRLNKPVRVTRLCNTLAVAGANNSTHLSNTGRSCSLL